MMRIAFRPEAHAEALEAEAWYEARVPGLGFEFTRSIEVAVSSAARDPEQFPRIEGELRRVLLRRFPYSLVFACSAELLLVVAVLHHRRRPRSLRPHREP